MCTEILHKYLPGLAPEIDDYVCGVLSEIDDFGSVEDVTDALGTILLESHEEATQELVNKVCATLFSSLKGDVSSKEDASVAKLLNAPVKISDDTKKLDSGAGVVNSIWMALPHDRTQVDQKKLAKAESKMRQKKEKRALKDESSNSAKTAMSYDNATVNQASNRKQDEGSGGGGRVYDIKIEDFDISFGKRVLLSSANLSMTYGRRYGLVGRNGVGKSTLLRMISKRELRVAKHIKILHVEQEVDGDDTVALQSVLECDEERERLLAKERELTSKTQSSDAATSTSEQLTQLYSRLEEIDASSAPSRASAILAGLAFTPTMQAMATREFSGGWRMRLALARALFTKPDLLLLDEPTNMLDMKAIVWLENYLQEWPTTLLLVSHDRTFLDTVTTDIIHMHSERLDCYRGNYAQFIQTRHERLTCQQKEYETQMQYRQHLQDYIDRWRYNANRAPQAQSKLKILEKLPELKPVVAELEVKFKFPVVDKFSGAAIKLSEITFSYGPSQQAVFSDVTISAQCDSCIAVVGENGTGKTTLLKLLLEELSPQEGFRHVHRNLRIGYFSQHHVDQLVMDITPLELIQSKFPGHPVEHYRHQLGSYGVTGELALRPVASLSGGQKSRLAFALMAAKSPNFLILDEPTNHLDVETVEALGKALTQFNGGVILVSHDEQLIRNICNEVWMCKDQKVTILEGISQYRTQLEKEILS
ncbi:ATP-binding cassette sub-family F member 3-like [Dysidea avara]|uniref:ATP-binding cassette sub-family F member 3-like n=1 Tax=Dysidea avara TaxID=196820 RepID=UPI003332B727